MPSIYAHHRFGEDMYSYLSEPLRKLVDENRTLYDVGQHGPDLLFHYKVVGGSNPVQTLGYELHEMPGEYFFAKAADILRGPEEASGIPPSTRSNPNWGAAWSYALGVLGHFALDNACHSYIEQKIAKSGVPHFEIEMEFDRFLLVEDGYNPLSHSITDHIIADPTNAEIISRFYSPTSVEEILGCLKSIVTNNKVLLCPNSLKRNLLFAIMTLAGKTSFKKMIMSKNPNPLCADSNIRLLKIYHRTLDNIREMADNFQQFVDNKRPLLPVFKETFSAGEGWQNIPVYSLEDELKYEL